MKFFISSCEKYAFNMEHISSISPSTLSSESCLYSVKSIHSGNIYVSVPKHVALEIIREMKK